MNISEREKWALSLAKLAMIWNAELNEFQYQAYWEALRTEVHDLKMWWRVCWYVSRTRTDHRFPLPAEMVAYTIDVKRAITEESRYKIAPPVEQEPDEVDKKIIAAQWKWFRKWFKDGTPPVTVQQRRTGIIRYGYDECEWDAAVEQRYREGWTEVQDEAN